MLEEIKKELSFEISKILKCSPHEVVCLLEKPRAPEFGDLTLPCFKLKDRFKVGPDLIAKDILAKIQKPKSISEIKIFGPYVNFYFDYSFLAQKILTNFIDKTYFEFPSSKEKIMVEGFGQPNTHKAFHIGHFRNVCISDSIVRILKFTGNKVISANYIGDMGTHVAKWLWFFTKFYKGEIPKENIEKWLNEIYAQASKAYEKHESAHLEVSEILNKLENKKDKDLLTIWGKTRVLSLKVFSKVYEKLGVIPDVVFYESKMNLLGKKMVKFLLDRKIAKKDQGAIIVDLKNFDLGVFVILKSDGAALYSTRDLALAKLKFEKYKINRSIYVIASEQSYYLKQLFKTLELANIAKTNSCIHIPYGLVLFRGKKIASRTGEVITFQDVFEDVKLALEKEILKRNEKIPKKELKSLSEKLSLAALKFAMLKQSSEKSIDFDIEQILSFEGETGPSILYSLVRAKKILEKVKIKKLNLKNIQFNLLKTEQERNLIKLLLEFKEIVTRAAEQYQPHLIANYAFKLTQAFNEFYEFCPVSAANHEQKFARVVLVTAFINVLRKSLNLLGIEEVSRM